MRKSIEVCAQFCDEQDLSDWRQSQYNIRKLKKLYRRAQRIKHSTSRDEAKREARREEIKEAHRAYLERAEAHLRRARDTRMTLVIGCGVLPVLLADLDAYIAHAERQIDQIRRRVIFGQTIPHAEKVFSIFEPHTEWISKGKAGLPRSATSERNRIRKLHPSAMSATSPDAGLSVARGSGRQWRCTPPFRPELSDAFTCAPPNSP